MSKTYPNWFLSLRRQVFNIFAKYYLPRWIVFTMDIIAVFLMFLCAYLLRFNLDIDQMPFPLVWEQALLVIFVFGIMSFIFRSYAGLIRHTTLTDISLIFIVTTLSTAVVLLLSYSARLFWPEFILLNIPVSVVIINFVLITVFLFSVRVIIKIIFRFVTSSGRTKKRVLIYGAGELGFIVKRVILSDPENGFSVLGFIDDEKNLIGKKINQIPVFGYNALRRDFISKNRITSLILAIKDIDVEKKSRIIKLAVGRGLEVLETPEVSKWVNGQLQARQFQKVKLEDLLGRKPIKLNLDLIREGLDKKTILVTGAAGSIGSEIVRQLTRFNNEKLILVDDAETPLFYLENEIREKFTDLQARLILGDVTHPEKMEQVFRDFRPDIVFHAAAYKHVSLIEENPHEALRVNVGGTRNMTELAVRYGVSKFVMISTDKSVNPTSVMGVTKRICEKIVQASSLLELNRTQFIVTRFGNVLGSNGSVIPIFSNQIARGGPVTVTHPEVFRYFMTISEACQLVLEAGFMGKGGEIFVFDMGEPVKIADLARNMIRLSGLEPGRDIKIEYTGLRPGEKLVEELLTDKEITKETHHPKIRIANVEPIDEFEILSKIDFLLQNLYSLTRKEAVKLISEIVPEYKSSNVRYNGYIASTEPVNGTQNSAHE
ncbi:MAG TPA: nucleoside-diphosphate sugar epimerase/dehydratase [Bacteroidales bacterium]|nr:nucleoside-diphosphate sugar epimerase/dehydratase [Bacteroidales bacterium]